MCENPDPAGPSIELGGLYKLAVSRVDALEVAAETLAMMERNTKLLSVQERVKLGYLHKRLAEAANP
jgi:hypothetical protein